MPPIGNTQGLKWQPAHDGALSECLAKNMSLAQAAAFINEKFETSYSRNSAIGRANRLGIKSGNAIGKHVSYKSAKPKNRPRVRIIASIESAENIADMKLRCVEIIPRNISLINLEPSDCRYPYGDGPITFCGHPKMEGSSYCMPHHALAVTHHLGVGHASSEAQKAASRKSIASIIILQNDAVNVLDLA